MAEMPECPECGGYDVRQFCEYDDDDTPLYTAFVCHECKAEWSDEDAPEDDTPLCPACGGAHVAPDMAYNEVAWLCSDCGHSWAYELPEDEEA